jgi:hypothetical protein
VNNG